MANKIGFVFIKDFINNSRKSSPLDDIVEFIIGNKSVHTYFNSLYQCYNLKYNYKDGSSILDLAKFVEYKSYHATISSTRIYQNRKAAIALLDHISEFVDADLTELNNTARKLMAEITRYFQDSTQTIILLPPKFSITTIEYLRKENPNVYFYFQPTSKNPRFEFHDHLYSLVDTCAFKNQIYGTKESQRTGDIYPNRILQKLHGILNVSELLNSNDEQFERNFFLVFRNKLLLKVILGHIHEIYMELGYHISETRKYNDLSLYFLVRHGYTDLLKEILKKEPQDSTLLSNNGQFIKNTNFLKIFFREHCNNLELVQLLFNRFKEFCTENSLLILKYSCCYGNLQSIKFIMTELKIKTLTESTLSYLTLYDKNTELKKYFDKFVTSSNPSLINTFKKIFR